jgi:mRNA interferase MazF
MSKAPIGWHPRRGDVCWFHLDKDHPALVISSDTLNRHALDVCVVPITSVHHGRFALRVALRPGEGGLKRDSWAKCDQVTTLDKQTAVYPPMGRISDATMSRIEESVRLTLDLV